MKIYSYGQLQYEFVIPSVLNSFLLIHTGLLNLSMLVRGQHQGVILVEHILRLATQRSQTMELNHLPYQTQAKLHL